MFKLLDGSAVTYRGELKPNKENLVAGNYVKVKTAFTGNDGSLLPETEEFWVRITSADGDNLVGEINNDLVHGPNHGIDDGVSIDLNASNVGAVLPG